MDTTGWFHEDTLGLNDCSLRPLCAVLWRHPMLLWMEVVFLDVLMVEQLKTAKNIQKHPWFLGVFGWNHDLVTLMLTPLGQQVPAAIIDCCRTPQRAKKVNRPILGIWNWWFGLKFQACLDGSESEHSNSYAWDSASATRVKARAKRRLVVTPSHSCRLVVTGRVVSTCFTWSPNDPCSTKGPRGGGVGEPAVSWWPPLVWSKPWSPVTIVSMYCHEISL